MLTSREVLDRITSPDVPVSYRMLDHLASRHPDGDLGRAQGAGTPRVWDHPTVARLEVATALAAACPGVAWGVWAAAVTDPRSPDPPRSGWVLVDDLFDVHYATDTAALAALMGRGNGGSYARFVRTP